VTCSLPQDTAKHLATMGAIMAIIAIALMPSFAFAGTGGATEFGSLYTLLTGWMTGTLGKVVAVVFILVGVIGGAARGSIMGFVMGIAAGVGMFLAPDIIDGVVTATLPIANAIPMIQAGAVCLL